MWWLLALGVAALPFAASAQEEPGVTGTADSSVREAGIPLGAFLFSPSLEAIYERKDNIFLTDKLTESDTVYVVRPRLLLELPVSENYFRLVYTPQWRDYKDHDEVLDEKWSHFLDFRAVVDTPGGFEMRLDNRLARGGIETWEYDPGREVYYATSPFLKDSAALGLGYSVSETDYLGVVVSYDTVRFDDDPITNTDPDPSIAPPPVFSDYDNLTAGFAYRRALGPLLALGFELGTKRSTVDDFESRDSKGFYASVGLSGELTPNLTGDIRAGYEKRRFDREADGRRQEFKGFTLDTRLRYAISDTSSMEFVLTRTPYLSGFEDQGFYVSDYLGVNLDLGLVDKLFLTAGAGLGKNDYDRRTETPSLSAKRRSDDLRRFQVGIGYHFTDFLSLRANWRRENRDSNLAWVDHLNHPFGAPYDYSANVYMVNLVVGY
jgi:hypothetical protein